VCDTRQSETAHYLWKETHFAVAIVTAEYINSAPILLTPKVISIPEDNGK